jgi:undecaprenyl-diphosphatase
MAQALPPKSHQFTFAVDPGPASSVATARRRPPLPRVGFAAALLFLLLTVHALLYEPDSPGSLDLWLMRLVQRIDPPGLGPRLDVFGELTASTGAVAAWMVTLVLFVLLRWWLPSLVLFCLPLGGVISETFSRLIVQRTRPHVAELRRQSLNWEERSFPSGHVVGAILLYGLIWYVAGRRIASAPLRRLVRFGCGAVIVLSGFNRVWGGAHWPSDVIGAYALGFALLAALILVSEWIEREATWVASGGEATRPWPVCWPLGAQRAVDPLVRVFECVLVRYRWLAVGLARPPEGGSAPGSAP